MLNRIIDKLNRRAKKSIVFIIDLLIIVFSLWLSYFLKFDNFFIIAEKDIKIFVVSICLFSSVFIYQGNYNNIFRYSINSSIKQIGMSSAIYGLLFFTIISIIQNYTVSDILPRSIAFIHTAIIFLLINFSRLIIYEILKSRNKTKFKVKNIAIYGSGSTAVQISNLIAADPGYRLFYFIDEDPDKKNTKINDTKIITINDINDLYVRKNIKEIIIAKANLSIEEKKKIIEKFSNMNLHIRFIENLKSHIEQFSLEHFQNLMLDRFIHGKKYEKLSDFSELTNKTILITGAGGSIGSELTLQIMKYDPSKIILFDHSEYNLYQISEKIKTELILTKKNIQIINNLGTIKDTIRLENVFNEYKPEFVFHAAAYKHVPLVEENVIESISNNILGTKNVLDCSLKHNVKRFILVSTDKAVRPTNVMGATKRVAELYVQNSNNDNTITSIVRFGNVFGSSGSVIPLFYKQITNGGPVTITHKEVTRFLMSIPEAVNLILEASLYATGKKVFVLDMGEPVSIFKLAEKMINQLGLSIKNDNNPDGDIEIKITGLRPGEKLHEELLIGENYKVIKNSRLIIAEEEEISKDQLEIALSNIEKAIHNDDQKLAKQVLSRYVVGFS